MDEKEATLFYEQRRKELFRGFTDNHKTNKSKPFPTVKPSNLKEFIVYNTNPQKKTLKKSLSSYPTKPIKNFKKNKIVDNNNKINSENQNPSQISTTASIPNKKDSNKKPSVPKFPYSIRNVKKSLSFVEKTPKVLMIDLRELKKKTVSSEKCLFKVERIVRNTKKSRECSLIMEEEVKKIEEDFNRSRSCSFNSYSEKKNL